MSAFFCKKLVFFVQKSTLTQNDSVRAVFKIFWLFSVFVRQKVAIAENITFADSVSGIWPPDCSKLAKNPKSDTDVIIFRHDVKFNSFLTFCFSCQVCHCSKFHVNIITGSGIMTIFFYKGLTRNPDIGNTLVWVLFNIWRLGQVMGTKFGTNIPNKMLLNTAKFQSYSFYRSWVIKGKPLSRKIILKLYVGHNLAMFH